MNTPPPLSPREVRGPFSGCWEWTGYRSPKGYGKVQVKGSARMVHRVVYEALTGPIPDGLLVCHTCDNPPCFNPAHLFVGTNWDNHADKVAKGRAWWQNGTAVGENNPNVRLTQADVEVIRAEYVKGNRRLGGGNSDELARRFGISSGHVRFVARKGNWKHV